MNPSITTVAVGTTPTLVFSGTGKVSLTPTSGDPRFGTSGVTFANNTTHLNVNPMEFSAPGEIYAVCDTGQSAVIRVTQWY